MLQALQLICTSLVLGAAAIGLLAAGAAKARGHALRPYQVVDGHSAGFDPICRCWTLRGAIRAAGRRPGARISHHGRFTLAARGWNEKRNGFLGEWLTVGEAARAAGVPEAEMLAAVERLRLPVEADDRGRVIVRTCDALAISAGT